MSSSIYSITAQDASKKNVPHTESSVSCRRTAAECADGPVYLSDVDPAQRPWDTHKAQADDVMEMYAQAVEFERYAVRMSRCAGYLEFGWNDEQKRLKLVGARYCRVRHCPVCQWRRALSWIARFYEALPKIKDAYPKARWLLLTLTVRNCALEDLRQTLRTMNKAWNKLTQRKELRAVLGWVRTVEVTRGRDGSAHPHFHALLMVRPSYFAKDYIKQARWTELWKESLGVTYTPVVHVKAVRQLKPLCEARDPLHGAVAEALKYAVKPADLTSDPEWLHELTRQLHHMRFVATGGVLKDLFREPTDEEMIDPEGVDSDQNGGVFFAWKLEKKRYSKVKTL